MKPTRVITTGLVLVSSFALGVGLATISDRIPTTPAPTYRLEAPVIIGEEVMGFTIDYDMSYEDCQREAANLSPSFCVVENPIAAPRLVAHGCAGATGPLYAVNEDDLPECARVQRRG